MGKTGISISIMLAIVLFAGPIFAQKVENSVYRITPAIGSRGGTLTGFACRIKNVSGIVTCLHGISPGSLYNAEGELKSFVRLSVKYVDIDHDLAFLSSDIISEEKEVLDLADGFPVANKLMKVLGYPAGMADVNIKQVKIGEPNLKRLSGMIPADQVAFFDIRQSPKPEINVLYIDGQMIPGHSGAPVLGDVNRVYGVVIGGVHAGAAGITWAIPVKNISWTDIASPGVVARVKTLSQHKLGNHQLYDFIFEEEKPMAPTPSVETTSLNGTWDLSMRNCYMLTADETPKSGHLVITGLLTLNFKKDNTITGKFSSNTSNCGTGDVAGKIDGSNIEITISCTKGSCFGGSFMITGTLNGKKILGKDQALPNRPSKCIMYISDQVTLQKQ